MGASSDERSIALAAVSAPGGSWTPAAGAALFGAPVRTAGMAARARTIPRVHSQACRCELFIAEKTSMRSKIAGWGL